MDLATGWSNGDGCGENEHAPCCRGTSHLHEGICRDQSTLANRMHTLCVLDFCQTALLSGLELVLVRTAQSHEVMTRDTS